MRRPLFSAIVFTIFAGALWIIWGPGLAVTAIGAYALGVLLGVLRPTDGAITAVGSAPAARPSIVSGGSRGSAPSACPKAGPRGAASGPAPLWSMPFLVAWIVGGGWLSGELANGYVTAIVVALGFLAFWLLVERQSTPPPMPPVLIVPMLVAFGAGVVLVSGMAAIDDGLLAPGFGVHFVLWLQLGLWMAVKLSDERTSRDSQDPSG